MTRKIKDTPRTFRESSFLSSDVKYKYNQLEVAVQLSEIVVFIFSVKEEGKNIKVIHRRVVLKRQLPVYRITLGRILQDVWSME